MSQYFQLIFSKYQCGLRKGLTTHKGFYRYWVMVEKQKKCIDKKELVRHC